jgi:hypothetical protein
LRVSGNVSTVVLGRRYPVQGAVAGDGGITPSRIVVFADLLARRRHRLRHYLNTIFL